jgi:hypothetical protein
MVSVPICRISCLHCLQSRSIPKQEASELARSGKDIAGTKHPAEPERGVYQSEIILSIVLQQWRKKVETAREIDSSDRKQQDFHRGSKDKEIGMIR